MTCSYCKEKPVVFFYLPNLKTSSISTRVTGLCGKCAELADKYLSANISTSHDNVIEKNNEQKRTSSRDSKDVNSKTESRCHSSGQEG